MRIHRLVIHRLIQKTKGLFGFARLLIQAGRPTVQRQGRELIVDVRFKQRSGIRHHAEVPGPFDQIVQSVQVGDRFLVVDLLPQGRYRIPGRFCFHIVLADLSRFSGGVVSKGEEVLRFIRDGSFHPFLLLLQVDPVERLELIVE